MAVVTQGQKVTFIPPENAVALTGDFCDWHRGTPIPLNGAEKLVLELPRNSWVEYAWLDAEGQAFADPDNATKSLNPWWSYPRAVEVGSYQQHPVIAQLASVPKGNVKRYVWNGEVFSGSRRVNVYTPPEYNPAHRYPVFYVQDGVAFYRTGRLSDIADVFVAEHKIEPAIFVFVEPADRIEEYYLNPQYIQFLLSEVMPKVESDYAVNPQRRGVWGASLGGLMGLYTASLHPELFSMCVTHSGAFLAEPNHPQRSAYQVDAWILKHLQQNPPKHLRMSVDTGTVEWLTAVNRRMAAFLAEQNISHQYREYPSGHNWVTWRNAIPEALLYILGL